ncbi:MAG: thiamine pyrophosphate-dependent enzyme [Anaerolineae bacterium]|nr:thiamine pyrophosphate-dependent enzyme [Anaerolineae bacterium]
MAVKLEKSAKIKFDREEVVFDYRLAYQSRQASLIGRREVLSGKAKFGIFGDGKEVAQIAMAKYFKRGDFRSGYYRDQTLMLAVGEHKLKEFFAQLYAHKDLEADPATAGRSMNAHFATRSLNPDGSWRDLLEIHNSSADISPTASQMPRLVGLAHASKLYRAMQDLDSGGFSKKGNEVAFGTIGNASCSEGMFWESVNAIGVLKAPAVISIWDDGYGISVPNEYQLTKDLSDLLAGFQRKRGFNSGYELYRVAAWDYAGLIETYEKAVSSAREDHVPALIHVVDVTQPQGHSTSGSHERYKSAERLEWEKEYDCISKFRDWIVDNEIASVEELSEWEKEDKILVEKIREDAWEAFKDPIRQEMGDLADMVDEIAMVSKHAAHIKQLVRELRASSNPLRNNVMQTAHKVLMTLRHEDVPGKQVLIRWKNELDQQSQEGTSSHLYSDTAESINANGLVPPVYSEDSPMLNGFEVLNQAFDNILKNNPKVVAFGEDVGHIGGVNQAFAGLQDKYGSLRVFDTGIRETTIIGQAIGLALRGFRPIAEIQYLDYMLYALQIISDDLATLHWRTKGGQKAPVIIRTRGHRLEGIWHSGSYMAGMIHLLRGVYVAVPRNMVQAAGFYNTFLKGENPAVVVEVLNGYRLKEKLPDNIGEFSLPLGIPEVLREGEDITIVTYGSLCRIALEAADILEQTGIQSEVIDVQTLLPFDINGRIVESLKKTNRILFLDEDVPGGTSAFMMQEVIEKQGGYAWLDSEPRTLAAQEHRPAYGTDGNYWSKPNVESIFETVYDLMHEVDPSRYPVFYK